MTAGPAPAMVLGGEDAIAGSRQLLLERAVDRLVPLAKH